MANLAATSDVVAGVRLETRRRWRFSLRTALIVVTLAAAAFAGVYYIRGAARQSDARTGFKMMVIGLSNFDDTFLQLPHPIRHVGNGKILEAADDPTAKALYSWRFAVFIFIADRGSIGEPYYDQPWDSRKNAQWLSAEQPFSGYGQKAKFTRAFAITGPDTPFGDGNSEKPHAISELDKDTILIVEVRNSGVHWMEPGDFEIRTMPRTINAPDGRGISGEHAGGFFVGFADGEAWFLGNDVPFDELAKFFTIAGAKANDRDVVLKPYQLN